MPNLTSYHPPAIHLNREIPKTYCDLIQHEYEYIQFLHTRIANIQSSLSFINKNDNYHNQRNISHFRLRQKRWKEKIDNENKRFIYSLIYHQNKYQPMHNQYIANKDYKHHLKLLQSMSQYSKYRQNNFLCKNLFNHDYLTEFNKQKRQINETNKQLKTNKYSYKSSAYIENLAQQSLNNAIQIYNQPLPSPSSHMKSSYSKNNQWLKSRLYPQQKLFRSISSRQLLQLWYNSKQLRGKFLRNYTNSDNMISKKIRLFN